MTTQVTIGVRRKVTIAFAAACMAIVAFTAAVIEFQHHGIDLGAQVEARNMAKSVAAAAARGDEDLQRYVDEFQALYGRDITIVDTRKIGIADADPVQLGRVFTGDPADELGKTLSDGQARLFVEHSLQHPEGAKQIILPVYHEGRHQPPVVGAVILEYTQIYDELAEATAWQIYSVAGAGALCTLLVAFLGSRLGDSLSRRV